MITLDINDPRIENIQLRTLKNDIQFILVQMKDKYPVISADHHTIQFFRDDDDYTNDTDQFKNLIFEMPKEIKDSVNKVSTYFKVCKDQITIICIPFDYFIGVD